MGFLEGSFNQKAVYWGSPTTDGFGKLTFADPVEIDVRWEEHQELFMSAAGKEEISKANVYSATDDFENDAYLYLGELDDIDSGDLDNPQNILGAFPIRAYYKKVSIDGADYFRKAWL
jgi:hypothetical protein